MEPGPAYPQAHGNHIATQKPASVRQWLVCGRRQRCSGLCPGRGRRRRPPRVRDHLRAPCRAALFLAAQTAQVPAAALRRIAGLAHDRDGVAKRRLVVLTEAAEPCSRPGRRRDHGVRHGAGWRLREVLVGALLLLARRLCLNVCFGALAAGVAASAVALFVVRVGVVRLAAGRASEGFCHGGQAASQTNSRNTLWSIPVIGDVCL